MSEFALKLAEEQTVVLRKSIAQLEADIESIRRGYWEAQKHIDELEAENVELKRALMLIGDIGYDYDGYRKVDSLKKLIDEMVGYARNPQSAVDVLTEQESDNSS